MMLVYVLIAVLVFMAVVMASGWLFQKQQDNSGWVDVFWTFGTGAAGVACVLLPLGGQGMPGLRQWIVAVLVAIWSVRLGTYIVVRVTGSDAEDARYKMLKQEWGAGYQGRMFWFMQIQAPATMLLCLSIVLAAQNPTPGLHLTDLLGALVLATAIFGEGVADQQMHTFKASNPPKGSINDHGLWGISRHPNYVFEGFGWLAYPVIALGGQWNQPLVWLVWLGPAFMFGILRFATGVPPLEAAMLASRGEAFREYQSRVPVFFPNPFFKRRP